MEGNLIAKNTKKLNKKIMYLIAKSMKYQITASHLCLSCSLQNNQNRQCKIIQINSESKEYSKEPERVKCTNQHT